MPGAMELVGRFHRAVGRGYVGFEASCQRAIALLRVSGPDVLVTADDVTNGKPDPSRI